LNPLERTRLEKAAADCGFELSPEMTGQGLVFRSTQFPEFITVQSPVDGTFMLHASVPNLLPTGAPEGLAVHGWNVLYQVLDKAAAIARTMPNRVADKYHQATATLPKSTEAERWVVQRVGQDLFRGALLDYWQGRCCVTGLAIPELLRASHIKPWARCESDEERLDVFNGLLLAPHLDAMFDGGWMTVQIEGNLLFSKRLPAQALQQLGVLDRLKVEGLTEEHQAYLGFHRNSVFKD
jgi:putative restriction endonuclease